MQQLPRPDYWPGLQVARLCAFGHSVGKLLQYRHQGFLPNKRQQLSGGLAALELAQTLRNVVGLCLSDNQADVCSQLCGE